MPKIKQIPEDFVVNEITHIKSDESGDYSYFWLTKRNATTLDALSHIAELLHVQPKRFGFAGTKDKFAVTTQLCSAFSLSKERIESIHLNNISLKFLGYGKSPISLGSLEANSFEVVVRDINPTELPKLNKSPLSFINYFDEQRFSENNVAIGRAIIKKNFKKAAELVAKSHGNYNSSASEHLKKHAADYIGALRITPLKILKLFIHAYQSWLWNETAAEIVTKSASEFREVKYSLGNFVFTEKVTNIQIPVLGFGTEISDKEIETITESLLKHESITLRDFIIPQLPEISSEGTERSLIAEAKNFSFETAEDDLNPKQKKLTLKFTLPKGSYATIFVKSLINIS